MTPATLRGSREAERATRGGVGSSSRRRHVPGPPCGAALVTLAVLVPLPGSAQDGSSFDHRSFDELVGRHVTVEGMVDYDAFARSDAFRGYLEALDHADPGQLGERERLALWVNAYNAWTIALINRHGERESIRNINRTMGLVAGKGPWRERLARVGGETYTLDEIEHEVIRKRFTEPRIHFALVCAAVGCPPLRREAYIGAELDAQLDDQARRFLTESPSKNRVDAARAVVHLSPLFEWYREDFPPGREELGRYLAGFFPPGPERTLLESGHFDVRHTEYDWSLNLRRRDRGGRAFLLHHDGCGGEGVRTRPAPAFSGDRMRASAVLARYRSGERGCRPAARNPPAPHPVG